MELELFTNELNWLNATAGSLLSDTLILRLELLKDHCHGVQATIFLSPRQRIFSPHRNNTSLMI